MYFGTRLRCPLVVWSLHTDFNGGDLLRSHKRAADTFVWTLSAGVSLTGGRQVRLPGQRLQGQRLPAAHRGDRLLHRLRGRPLQLRGAHAETLPGTHRLCQVVGHVTRLLRSYWLLCGDRCSPLQLGPPP